MTPHDLLANFETLAEAPNGIQRLRELVLELAVRGKLVEQDPGDEPASELLKRIKTEKTTLVREGGLKRVKASEPVHPSDIPFEIPEGWAWARLTEAFLKITDGTHHSPPNGPSGDFRYVTAKNIKPKGVLLTGITYVSRQVHQEIYSRCNPEFGDILYIKDGATTGVVTVNDLTEPCSLLSSVGLLKTPHGIVPWFACYAIRSEFFFNQLREQMTGVGIPRVTLSKLESAFIPIPPLLEQQRIVARVDELMALLDRLETKRQERESARTAARDSALAALREAPTPEDVEVAWLRVQERFGELFATSQDVEPLRQAILQLAMRGYLVTQIQSDGTAEALLRDINSFVSKKIRCGEIPKRRHTEPIKDSESPFALPTSWTWARLADLCSHIVDCLHRTPKYSQEGIPAIRTCDMSPGKINIDKALRVNESEYSEQVRRLVPMPGDVFYSREGSFGIAAVIPSNAQMCLSQRMMQFRLIDGVDSHFFSWAMNSPVLFQQAKQSTIGATVPHINIRHLVNFLFPLPPYEEQKRIVKKLEAMMTLLDCHIAALDSKDQLAATFSAAAVHHLDI